MNEADALEIMQRAIFTVLVVSSPVVGAAMAVGIVIALLQALTQVQEMTLTFVPKIIAGFVIIMLTGSYSGSLLRVFTEHLYLRIATGFK